MKEEILRWEMDWRLCIIATCDNSIKFEWDEYVIIKLWWVIKRYLSYIKIEYYARWIICDEYAIYIE